jgi:hypothetical protein
MALNQAAWKIDLFNGRWNRSSRPQVSGTTKDVYLTLIAKPAMSAMIPIH